jgi:integrase
MSRTVIPPAYRLTIISASPPPSRRLPLGTSRSSKLDVRSRGTSRPTGPTSVCSVFGVVPFRESVSAIATRLKHFGVFLADVDPDLDSITALDRRKHIEPYLACLVDAINTKNGEPITVADRSRRVLALTCFLTDITEWGWPEAPARKLLFGEDNPKLPRVLPRYLPVDVDRRLTAALTDQPGNELAATALRLQRSCGLRIGELLDLELDCVHEVPEGGSWLKVPLGKLETERMVPIDEDILALIDRITELRSHGRPLPHPRYRRPAQFLTRWQ